ncbi:uncharacterized protein LOC111336238 [Stylophora pistillata]|uniref:uncharacterized protein LOC111336238 n=1 Tax=Stylophora pistillata TaxID=50429 RepID=UPI000C04E14A|nr:uncharacterized protein LOC111336238 [Stylophora pistillata]
MPNLGKIEEFDPTSTNINRYLERLEQYYIANGVRADTGERFRRRGALISVIGSKAYDVLSDLCSPEAPSEKTYGDLATILKDHFAPKKLLIAERYQFHNCIQLEGESISTFAAKLKHLASTCNFGTHLNEALRDRLVCGLRNKEIQKKLLTEEHNFDEALTKALGAEAAQTDVAAFSREDATPVNKLSSVGRQTHRLRRTRRPPCEGRGKKPLTQNQNNSTSECLSCGKTGHARSQCKYRNYTCHSCGQGITAKLEMTPDAQPKFCKACPVPYALQEAVDAEYHRLESEGIVEKVEFSEWATPMVHVPKADGTTRSCGDYAVTVKPQINVPQYPIPLPEDVFVKLRGGKRFTKLHLKNAYQQLPLDLQSQQFVTINTHRGLYRYKRLPFGIASSPAIFQRTMDIILEGLEHVSAIQDDILITGKDDEKHIQNLNTVLSRLDSYGLRLQLNKCKFMQRSVTYMGCVISAERISPTEDKVEAIKKAPRPENCT